MAESTSRPGLLSERGDDLQAYRPISGLAIAGAVVAVLYAACVLVGAFAAFSSRVPLLLPLSLSILLPLVAVGLCYAAMLQIRWSEGTRAGLALANWGWWLSVVFGLGYLAFYAATYFAIRGQADEFMQRWFERIREGKINHAFLMTQEPVVQENVNPEDAGAMRIRFDVAPDPTKSGLLTMFRQLELVRAIQADAAETKIIPLGVREWEAVGQVFSVRRAYRVTNSYGEYEALVSVQGKTSTKGEFDGRRWSVRGDSSIVSERKLTPKGQRVEVLRRQSQAFTQKWLEKLSAGALGGAYEDIRDPRDRAMVGAVYTSRIIFLNTLLSPPLATAAGPAPNVARLAALMNPVWSIETYMPGYRELTDKLVQIDERQIRADDDSTRKSLANSARALFRPTPQTLILGAVAELNSIMRDAPVYGERLQLTHDCQLGFPPLQGVFEVTVESSPGFEDPGREPTWKVIRVQPVSVRDLSKQLPVPPGVQRRPR